MSTEEKAPTIYAPLVDTPGNYLREPADAHPPLDYPPYKSTSLRHPKQPLIYLPHTITEITGPALGDARLITAADADLTTQHDGEPIGERIDRLRPGIRHRGQAAAQHAGRGLAGQRRRPVPPSLGQLAGSAGPELHRRRTVPHRRRGPLPLHHDQAGPYPWGNHYNAWRPAHIHFSLMGRAFTQRLVTQMYFPGDPFFPYDPIFNSVRDEQARERMISEFSIHGTQPDWAQAYEFDIYLRGPAATPFEEAH